MTTGTIDKPTTKTIKKKPGAKPAAAVKKPVKKIVKKAGAVHVARTPEQVVAEQTGQTFHGTELTSGNPKKSGRAGVLTFLELKQLQIIPDFNPRSTPGPVDELASSIKAEGILSSLVVRPSKVSGKFDIIAGERRFKAAKAADYQHAIPCIIRTDLLGDDERSLAVALAENGEDARNPLNMIEVGRACKILEKKGWSASRIAKETGIHAQRVRRAIDLVETPSEVQKQIEEGNWSVAAGLEYARLDDKARKAIKDKINQATTADDIRKLRKAAERDEIAKKAAKGEPATKTTKTGTPSKKAPITIWRGSREKQAVLQELCATLASAEGDQIGSADYHELRGAIGYILWDRGDRKQVPLPDLSPSKDEKDYAAQMKDLAGFNAVVKAEAAKYKPETDAEKSDGDEGA